MIWGGLVPNFVSVLLFAFTTNHNTDHWTQSEDMSNMKGEILKKETCVLWFITNLMYDFVFCFFFSTDNVFFLFTTHHSQSRHQMSDVLFAQLLHILVGSPSVCSHSPPRHLLLRLHCLKSAICRKNVLTLTPNKTKNKCLFFSDLNFRD